MNFDELRSRHEKLIYGGFQILHENGNLKIVFDFVLSPDIKFNPEVIIPNISKERLDAIGPDVLENLVFNLGMVELLSYWKAACPKEIIIKAGFLNEDQILFWKNLLIKGLGEFFYNNQIDFTKNDLVKFVILRESSTEGSESDSSLITQNDNNKYAGALKNRDLILVGGGKDSAVTLDILKKSNRESDCLSLNPIESTKKIIEIAGYSSPIYIQRIIDPKLLELNDKGYLNGHTPFSAYLAFLSTIAGILYDYKNIIVSNEASSNEGNISWNGSEINHQYSKTFEFENLFRDYSKKYLSLNSNYFSFLRPLSELQIAKLFAGMPAYHKEFRSCNIGSKANVWCLECPKCVSTYLILYPFLGDKLIEIFGENMLEDENIISVVKGLLRVGNSLKPFECVATVEEIKVAIYLGIEYSKSKNIKAPLVLENLKEYASGNAAILDNWNSENNLPESFQNLLKEKINAAK